MVTQPTPREPTPREEREHRETERQSKSPLVVVELSRRRSPEQVRRLRKGRGRLLTDIEDAVDELVKSGTIKSGTQPSCSWCARLRQPCCGLSIMPRTRTRMKTKTRTTMMMMTMTTEL